MSDDELPPLSVLLRLKSNASAANVSTAKLRRSPRKHAAVNTRADEQSALGTIPELSASSKQRRSPTKEFIPKKMTQRSGQAKEPKIVLMDIPELSSKRKASEPSRRNDCGTKFVSSSVIEEYDDGLVAITNSSLGSSLKMPNYHTDSTSEKENTPFAKSSQKAGKTTSAMSKITQAARRNARGANKSSEDVNSRPKRSNPYILKEAHCEDLNESSGTDGEESETDLSGFIVDDDATLSFDGSAIEISSDEGERKKRSRNRKQEAPTQVRPRRRLIRGRKTNSPHPDDKDDTTDLLTAFNDVRLGEKVLEQHKNKNRRRTIEVVDLTSSPVSECTEPTQDSSEEGTVQSQESVVPETDPLSLSMANLILQPSSKSRRQLVPSRFESIPSVPVRQSKPSINPSTTPPTTPPREQKRPQSPTKLKSPCKLFSPSKRALEAPRSPVRQSLDAFWDHNVINQWTDTFSPKKAVLGSPQRKILMNSFKIHEDDDSISGFDNSNNDEGALDDTSDSLPSPCDSPAKGKLASPSKFAALRADTVKRKELKAAKLKFDSEKEKLALDLFTALDFNITSSKISALSASTGGIKISWSKTLRSTAGRANWKRSVTKASGSPMKGNSETIDSEFHGVLVQHYASIELAEKIIDREERLVNTLAHEFCHLANFMISNIRDQPHGSSFQQWGRKVTSFLRSSAAKRVNGYKPSWSKCEVTTKHSYVVEYKYLFACIGRPKEKRTMAEKFLDLDDEEGCGAEYGRHSKSIDVDKQRCGRCKGLLVQVKPTPRATSSSPRKQSPRKKNNIGQNTGVDDIEKMIALVDLSD